MTVNEGHEGSVGVPNKNKKGIIKIIKPIKPILLKILFEKCASIIQDNECKIGAKKATRMYIK